MSLWGKKPGVADGGAVGAIAEEGVEKLGGLGQGGVGSAEGIFAWDVQFQDRVSPGCSSTSHSAAGKNTLSGRAQPYGDTGQPCQPAGVIHQGRQPAGFGGCGRLVGRW